MTCQQPKCRVVQCAVTDDLPTYLGSYSLQSGFTYVSPAISVPSSLYPQGYYIAAPGAIVITVPPVVPAAGYNITYQGCQSTITRPVPAGASQSVVATVVAQVMQLAAQQLAVCNAVPNPHSPGGTSTNPPVYYQNVAATQSCPAGLALKVIGTLPAGITSTSSGISIPAGVFTSQVSQFDADLQAGSFLANLFTTNVVECGWYNTDQQFLCANGTTYDEPAGTFFSEISQADANAQAQAALTATCPCLNFSNLVWTHVTNIYYAGDGGPTYPNWNTGINTVGGNSASISCYCGTSAVSTNQYNNRFTQKYTATIPAVAGGGTCWARLTYAITLQGQAPQGPANSFWGYQIGSPNNFPTPPPTVSITVTGAGTYSTQVSDSGYLDFSYDSSQSFTVSFQVDGGSPYDQLSGSRFFPYSVTAVMSLAPSQHP